jgi:hypothetical protein
MTALHGYGFDYVHGGEACCPDAAAETAVDNGGSPSTDCWSQTITEFERTWYTLAIQSHLIDAFLASFCGARIVDTKDRIHQRSRSHAG